MKRFLKRKAFTIIEMVIVIAVIGILAAVMIPTVSGMIEKANESADQQFAASLNIQLALESVDGGIKNESDLRDAVNKYYGKWEDEEKTILAEDGDYYNTKLKPKSVKSGNYFWYDYNNGTVFVGTVAEAAEKSAEIMGQPAPAQLNVAPVNTPVSGTFSPASLRSDLVEGLYLMGCGGKEGDLVDIITKFENLGNDAIVGSNSDEPQQQYEYAINKLVELAEESEAMATLLTKVQKTTIVTELGAFRHADKDSIEFVWIPAREMLLSQTKVFVYNEGTVDDGQNSKDIAGNNVNAIELPAGVKVALGGLPAPKVDEYADTDLFRDYANTTLLYVNVESVADLQNVFTDCVLVMPDDSRYVYVGDQYFKLPLNLDPETKLPTGSSSGSVNTETMGSIDEFGISCDETAGNPNEGPVYLFNGTLFVAYNKGDVQLSLTEGVTNSMVIWSVEDNADLFEVSPTGKVTIKRLPEKGTDDDAVIKATYKYNTEIYASITVRVVRPNLVELNHGFSVGGLSNEVTLTYTGDETKTFNLIPDPLNIGLNQSGYAKMEDCELVFTTTKKLFEVSAAGVLTIDDVALAAAGDDNTQELTITYRGKTTGTEYLKHTFTVTVVDQSECPIKVNTVNGVKMGEKYLFRVGNAANSPITLSDLFNGTTDKPITVTIYDAALGSEGERKEIGSTNSGFSAVYTAGATWSAGKIQFTGTGVAIIELTVGNKKVELAVEVVNGKNVTAYSQLDSSGNYVLLNNITLTADKYALSNGTIYGNGFTFDVSGGGNTGTNDSGNYLVSLNNANLDNVKVVGKVYTTYGISSSDNNIRATVLMQNTSGIYNSYVSNSMSAVRVLNGNATISNTTLKGGVFANLELRSGNTVLENVTTINQANANDKAENETVVGAGIAVWYANVPASTTLTVKGNLTQWNYVSQTDVDKGYIKSYSKTIAEKLLKTNGCYNAIDGVKWANTGIMSATTAFDSANITGLAGYAKHEADFEGLGSGATWTNTSLITADKVKATPDAYGPTQQKDILPQISYKTDKISGITGYSKFDSAAGQISVTVDQGTPISFDAKELVSFTKYTGVAVDISSVAVSGTGAKASGTTVTIPGTRGTYTITYSVKDNHCYKADGLKDNAKTREYQLTVLVGYNLGDAAISVKSPTKDQIKMVQSGVNYIIYVDYDWDYAIPLFDLLTIQDRDENNNLNLINSAEIKNLTVKASARAGGKGGWEIKMYDGKYWLVSNGAADKPNAASITFTFTYTGVNTKSVSASVTVNFPAANNSSNSFTNATMVKSSNFSNATVEGVTVTW